MTEFELKSEVSKFYKGSITIEKALKLYELEFGTIPTIEEDTSNLEVKWPVNTSIFEKYDLPTSVNEDSMRFMKQLQESGIVNMFMSAPHVQQMLLVSSTESVEIVSAYMKYYDELFYAENLV